MTARIPPPALRATPSPGGGIMRCLRMERNNNLTELARKLRKNQTKEEALLWYKFLSKYPVRFHRQYVIGDYIVDFYCHEAKLVVELDGSQHYDPQEIEKDQKRTAYLESLGLQVLRFTNLDVLQRFDAVCQTIDSKILSKGKNI